MPARKTQVNKVTNANLYVNGGNYLGRADEITLPDVKQLMTEHKGLGMFGKTELPNGIDKLEAKIKWNSFYQEVLDQLSDPRKAVLLQARGNLETHSGLGLENEVPFIVEMGGRVSANNLGAFKQNEATMPEHTMSVTYLKLTIDGREQLEIDVMENVYKVNGVDILATYRRNVGA
jgi:uncharacterized protein